MNGHNTTTKIDADRHCAGVFITSTDLLTIATVFHRRAESVTCVVDNDRAAVVDAGINCTFIAVTSARFFASAVKRTVSVFITFRGEAVLQEGGCAMAIDTGVYGAFIAITSARLITVGAVFCGFAPIIHTVRYFSKLAHALNTCVHGADVDRKSVV